MKKKSLYYVLNEDLIEEIKNFKKTCKYDKKGKYIQGSGKMNDKLGSMIVKIADGLAKKPNFNGYTWVDDMKSSAILTVIKYLHNFDPKKSKNPFGYVSMICYNAFIQYIQYSKKHSHIKQTLYDNKPTKFFDNMEFYNTQALDYEAIAG
jgi:DNA-directed RNA polymerase specialized sigma subunit